MLANGGWDLIQRLTLILLTWTVWRAPTNASKWRMGFNSAFKGLIPTKPDIHASVHSGQFIFTKDGLVPKQRAFRKRVRVKE